MSHINSTARHEMYGVKDESTRTVPVVKRGSPQFLPLVYLFTEKGDYIKRTVNFAEFGEYYGADSLNPTSKFFNHASELARTVFQAGGLVTVQRLAPSAEGTNPVGVSNIVINAYITDGKNMPKYIRASDGKIVRDVLGNPTDEGAGGTQVSRRYIYFTAEHNKDVTAGPTAVVYNDNTIDYQTTKYPLFEIKASGNGRFYNDIGFTMDVNLDGDNDIALSEAGQLQFNLGLVKRKNGRVSKISNNNGTPFVTGVLKHIFGHPITGNNVALEYTFGNDYGNSSDNTKPLSPKLTENININYDNVVTLQQLIKSHIDTVEGVNKYDYFDGTEKGYGLSNFLNCKSTESIEYESVAPMPNDPKIIAEYASISSVTRNTYLVDLSSETNNFLMGGEDLPGEYHLTIPYYLSSYTFGSLYEPAMELMLDKYADANSNVQNLAKNKESVFIDTGFSVQFKIKNMFKFFAFRKDVVPIASTYHNDGTNNIYDVGHELSVGSAVVSTLRMVQESSRYGTRAFRALIVAGSGLPADGVNPYRVPLSMDFAYKAILQMGASDGFWDATYAFDIQPNNVIDRLKEIEPKEIPDGAKRGLTEAGLIYPEPNDVNEFFYPQRQTVYEDSTSVLNSFPVAIAIANIEKALEYVWRLNSGADRFTNPELKIKVEKDLSDELDGKFGKQFIIVPTAYFTEFDNASGSSWSFKVDFYAPNMKTVMFSHIITRRKDK